MCKCLQLDIPGCDMHIVPGCSVKLGRFESTMWIVSYGWYSWGGNRPVCGWYLTDTADPLQVKPLQQPDLDDIYIIET